MTEGKYSMNKRDKSADVYLETKFGALCENKQEFSQFIPYSQFDFIDMQIQYVGKIIIRKFMIFLLKNEVRIFQLPLTPQQNKMSLEATIKLTDEVEFCKKTPETTDQADFKYCNFISMQTTGRGQQARIVLEFYKGNQDSHYIDTDHYLMGIYFSQIEQMSKLRYSTHHSKLTKKMYFVRRPSLDLEYPLIPCTPKFTIIDYSNDNLSFVKMTS